MIGNWRPHVAKSLGLGRETIRKLNPRIINLAISGFGETGPMAGKPVYDSLVQARTGLCHYGRPADDPKLSPLWIVDKVVGIQAAQAVLAALYAREKTGEGCDIDLAMLDATSYFNMPEMMQSRVFEGDASPLKVTPTTMFATSDGHILICPVNGKQMVRTLEAIGKPEWKKEITNIAHPVERTAAFYEHVGRIVKTRSSEEWLRIFDEHDVPAGPVWTVDQHLADPAVEQNEIYAMIGEPGDRMRAVRYPAIFNGRKLMPQRAASRIEPVDGNDDGDKS
jgi:formyl-CoA transferase